MLFPAHQVNSGPPGHALEEIGAKPLEQRLGGRKQAQLHGAHFRYGTPFTLLTSILRFAHGRAANRRIGAGAKFIAVAGGHEV